MSRPPVIQTLADLVRINSVNAFYEGGPGEREIADYIARFFHRHGIEFREQEVFANRPNIIARLPGCDASRRIVFEAHMDTVSAKGMTISPFDPVVRDGKMFGRGACDTKAGLAAMMHAVVSLKEQGLTPPCEVIVAAVADEEFSYRGVVQLCEGLQADGAVVAEPTELRCVIATKGVLRWRMRVRGRAAHSSRPQLGVNAIHHMARIILELEADAQRLTAQSHPLLGTATCNVGVIRGGVQVNFVPDECMIEIDRRLLPGEHIDHVLGHYQKILDSLKSRFSGFTAEMEPPMLTDEALETPPDASIVRASCAVMCELGMNDAPCGVPFGCDASKLSRAGIPSIVFGPGSIDQAHSAEEFVELEQVERALEFYRRLMLQFGSTRSA